MNRMNIARVFTAILMATCVAIITLAFVKTAEAQELSESAVKAHTQRSVDQMGLMAFMSYPKGIDGSRMKQADGTDCLLNSAVADAITRANKVMHEAGKDQIKPRTCFK